MARVLSRTGYYHLSVDRLKSLGSGQPRDRIFYLGDGLPDFIAWTKFDENNRSIYETILQAMRELLPDLDSIIVTQTGVDQQGIAMSFRGHRGFIAGPDLSDGTLLTLGLLCIIHGPNPPSLICIEEPETGINPRRLRWLFDRLVDMAYPIQPDRAPTQVVFSTHSPWLIDFFGGDLQESVLIVEQAEGRSRIRPLVAVQREALLRDPEPGDAIGHLWATGVYEGL